MTSCPQPQTYNSTPWPVIIILSTGSILVIYSAIAPNVREVNRTFAIAFLGLWSIAFAIILFKFWQLNQSAKAWWFLIFGITLLLIFTLFFVYNSNQNISN